MSILLPQKAYTQEIAQKSITVAVASSLYLAMKKQAQTFEQKHAVQVRLISGSTGRLYNQIMQGAPFDVFIAADAQRPALLEKAGKVIARYEIGYGYLGLMIGKHIVINTQQLLKSSIRHIAIANPEVAPFGKVSQVLLQQQQLWLPLQAKFVYAQNAMQALMMVKQGLVDAGFVPITASSKSIASIRYHAVLLIDNNNNNNNNNNNMAKTWLRSLQQLQQP